MNAILQRLHCSWDRGLTEVEYQLTEKRKRDILLLIERSKGYSDTRTAHVI